MKEDIKYILGALEIKSSSVDSFREVLIKALDDPLDLIDFAYHLKKEINLTIDIPEDRVPFYDLFLAIAQQKNNLGAAKEALSKALHDFQIRDLALNEALGEWAFSIFHFESKKYERAERACETAIDIMQNLIPRYEEDRKYEKTKEIKKHLSRLISFQKTIKVQPIPENAEDDTQKPGSSASNHPPLGPLAIPISLKARLQAIRDELQQRYDDLKERKQKIPPTLVAILFYLYRTITPAHSVYRTVPTPKTRREQEIYEALHAKVGFFEVIEQLVELEHEFEPTASREEILEKINLTWDQEVSQ